MPIDVRAERVIARPRPEVARYAMDWRNDPDWIGGISSARLITSEPLEVGSRVARVAGFLGRRIDYVLEVSELEPDARMVMRSVKAPFPMVVRYEFADAGAGSTRVAIHIGGDASGFYKLAAPLMARQVKGSISGDLERLDRLLTEG